MANTGPVHKSVVYGAKATCIKQLVTQTPETKGRNDINSSKIEKDLMYKFEIVWINVIGMVIIHLTCIYGFYLTLTSAKIWTIIWDVFVGYLGGFGVSAGSHRLWSHKAFKATLPMRILLMLLHSIANEDCIHQWVRDHRIHHKYTDTDADPYNSSRGFFFSHMGWLMLKKHPDVKKFGKRIDVSDLTSDPVVMFQKKYFLIIMPIMNIIIPTLIPMYFWGESFKVSFVLAVWKWVGSLHVIWTVNSVAHTWGYKPYDGSSSATDYPYLALTTFGESWHNYHHVFPWDYKVPDIPFHFINPTATFIDLFASFGLIYDLKTVSLDLAMKQANRKGDGTVKKLKLQTGTNNTNFSHKSAVWGWDDVDLTSDDRNGTEIHVKGD